MSHAWHGGFPGCTGARWASRGSGAGRAVLRGSAHGCPRQAIPASPGDRQWALLIAACARPSLQIWGTDSKPCLWPPVPGCPCKSGGPTVGSAYSRLCQAIPADAGDRQQALLMAAHARLSLQIRGTDSGLCGHRPVWSPLHLHRDAGPPGLGQQEPESRRQAPEGEAGCGPVAGLCGTALLTHEHPWTLITCLLAFPPALLPSGSKSPLNPFSHFPALSQASPPSTHLSGELGIA